MRGVLIHFLAFEATMDKISNYDPLRGIISNLHVVDQWLLIIGLSSFIAYIVWNDDGEDY